MKKLVFTISLILILSTNCFSETLTISACPNSMPTNLALGQFSPMIAFTYGDLGTQIYTLKVWFLENAGGGAWPCASTQWCEATYTINNASGTNSNGTLRVVQNMDVYAYTALAWIARLYNSSGVQVAWWERFLNGIADRPPVLAYIGPKNCLVGGKISFKASATDPENDPITYSAANLPTGATFDSSGNFNWTPSVQGTYDVYISANDPQMYDSEDVTLTVGPAPTLTLQNIVVPICGSTTANVTGKVIGVSDFTNFRIVCYIFISGYGWVTKPYSASPLTTINADGTFSVAIATGGIDPLATIVYLGVCNKDASIPILSGGTEIPASIPVYTSQKINRDPTNCHKVISWSGYEWYIKNSGGGEIGPGLNVFNDTTNNVFVDANGFLHLKIFYNAGKWECSEIVSTTSFGYGIYTFELASGISIDPNAVLGLFTWEDDAAAENNREIDIEVSQWGVETNPNAQYVIQPFQDPCDMIRFNVFFNKSDSTHRFQWEQGSITFQSYYNLSGWQTAASIIEDWVNNGTNVPSHGNENVRLNLWIDDGMSIKTNQEVVIKKFSFLCDQDLVGDLNGDCTVNMQDFAILADNWLSCVGSNCVH